MTARDNERQERRLSSFRIDDILATPNEPPETRQRAPTTSQPAQLSFGVDQLLANREPDPRSPLQCYVPCDYYQTAFCSPRVYSAHALACSPLGHSGCDACYSHTSTYPYMTTMGYTGLYDYERATLNKVHLANQVLPNQQKPRKPRRPWTRAVFSNLQRKGLEKRFQVQKYLTKADRHQLASMLGLSDNQVKVWFQNRRMKWRQDARESVAGIEDTKNESTTNSSQ